MRLTILASLLFVLGLAAIPLASASDVVVVGTVHGGYTYNGSYWTDASGRSYTRAKVYNPVTYYYDNYGRYYNNPQTYYWQYTLVADAPPAVVPGYSKDWRARHDDYRALRMDYDAYLLSAKSLGVGYLGANPFGTTYSGSYGSFGTSFNTLYGYNSPYVPYTVNQVSALYGSPDINVALASATRLVKNAQDLGGSGLADFQGLLKTINDGNANTAQILAAGLAIERAKSTPGGGGTVSAGSAASVSGTVPDAVPGTIPDIGTVVKPGAFRDLAVLRCGKCHTGATPKGSFNVLTYPLMTAAQKDLVLERILSDAPGKPRMPLAEAGGPGTKLTTAEIRVFASN